MKKENHFEMREYAIDMLGEEEESCVQGERRPYPLYPSKSGLSPIFLRDIILRYICDFSGNFDIFLKKYCFLLPTVKINLNILRCCRIKLLLNRNYFSDAANRV